MIMRWIFRLLVYFVRPLVCWLIAGYFAWQSVKAIAYAVMSYERAIERERIRAAANGGGTEAKKKKVGGHSEKAERPRQ